MLVPTEEEYIISMYQFYFMSGLALMVMSSLQVLELLGLSEINYSYLYETISGFLLAFSFPLLLFFLTFLPFLLELIRYWRKNLWLSLPLIAIFSQLIFLGLSVVVKLFIVPAVLCFIVYNIIATAAGIYGFWEVRSLDNPTLNRE